MRPFLAVMAGLAVGLVVLLVFSLLLTQLLAPPGSIELLIVVPVSTAIGVLAARRVLAR